MDVNINTKKRVQRSIRLTDEELGALSRVAKMFNMTNSDAVAMIFTSIAEEYESDKGAEEINIKIKLG